MTRKLSRFFVLSLTIATLSVVANAQGAEGDWEGTLKAGASEFRLVLHVRRDDKGTFKATLDSIDQNAAGIPVNSISVTGDELKFELPEIQASYSGKIKADGNGITGSWTQPGANGTLDFVRAKPKPPAAPRVLKPSDIDGKWEGSIDAGHATLPVIFTIITYEDGISATLDSPDQNLIRIPVTSITRTGLKVNMSLKQFGATYAGTLDVELKTIVGQWSQGGNDLQLNLKRSVR